MELRGVPMPIDAALLDWVTGNLMAMRDEYPDADLHIIHSAHGVTIEARAMRPCVLHSRQSGASPTKQEQKP